MHDIKVIEGKERLFVSMPSREADGRHLDIVHPINQAFRDKLEAAGISYHKLLALEEARRDMNDLAHHILLGWENGEGFPNG